jgi:hypothetical protein
LDNPRYALQFFCLGWAVTWAFWLSLTRSFHPTFFLAVIVTTSLVVVYACATYFNHWVLLPKFSMPGMQLQYWASLVSMMAFLTAVGLGVIRISYVSALGPDSDPNGLYKHYAIDFFGMVVHVGAAAVIARLMRWFQTRFKRSPSRSTERDDL